MNLIRLFSVFCAFSFNLVALDLSYAFESNDQVRQRLDGIQGKPAPELVLANWQNSDSLTLSDLKGKIVVLDFWATWCGPCIRSIPKNNLMAEKYKDDVVFIGVCHPRGGEKMQAVMAKHGIKFPIALDRDKRTIDAYRVNGYPDYYIIDTDGRVALADCSNSLVEKVLVDLLRRRD